jgi:hypothetical protein
LRRGGTTAGGSAVTTTGINCEPTGPPAHPPRRDSAFANLIGMGAVANKALAQCGLGFFVPIDPCDATVIDGEGTALAQMLRLGNQIVDAPPFPQQKAF